MVSVPDAGSTDSFGIAESGACIASRPSCLKGFWADATALTQTSAAVAVATIARRRDMCRALYGAAEEISRRSLDYAASRRGAGYISRGGAGSAEKILYVFSLCVLGAPA